MLRSTAQWRILLVGLLAILTCWTVHPQQSVRAQDIYRRENLVAWCIVPFDSQKRTPAQRAEMLDRMGIRQLAYDYRAEHIPTFDEELDQLAKHNIKLTAWWFPGQLNDEAKLILKVLEKHNVKTQLWVTGSGAMTKTPQEQQARVEAEAARIRTIAEAAAKQGCSVALYNHGGWFGEPENQIAIIQHLKLDNVGIVYNLHHGHSHVARFKELVEQMLPHLVAVNLNGMVPEGDKQGKKILPLGAGTLDLQLLKILRESGYKGPIGILNHTDEDAEGRLLDNLDGLNWLRSQLDGQAAGAMPNYRSWKGAAQVQLNRPIALNPPLPPADGNTSSTAPSPGNAKYDPQTASRLAADAVSRGSAERGVALFASAKTACLTCHKIGKFGGGVGPDLTNIGKERTPQQLAESLLWPNLAVEDKYRVVQALTGDGRIISGYRVRETDAELIVRDPSTGQETRLSKDDLDDVRAMPSVMPEGLTAWMSIDQQQDLVAFLSELGPHRVLRSEIVQSVLEHAQPHEPAGFTYAREPMDKHSRPDWQAFVNRDRIYDFYTKQAHAFRTQSKFEPLLAEYPGIDGGQQGHWGNQNEATWENDDWNATDLGSLQSGVFRAGKDVLGRAVCVRLGDQGELAACFDIDTLSYRWLWRGGFIKFSKVRHGFINPLEPEGDTVDLPSSAAQVEPGKAFTYLGLYRLGRRVVFAYRIGDTEYLDWPWVKDGKFVREVTPRQQHSLRHEIQRLVNSITGSNSQQTIARQWPQTFTTAIQLNRSGQGDYVTDSIELPWNNPWKALLYCSGHDFLPDGSALVCTMQGDVWHASGFSPPAQSSNATGNTANEIAWPKQARWQRFASGLHHALGLKISDDGIFVLGRDQITRLKDINGDGEADFYECFSTAYQTSSAGHDYICGLERDAQGNFYTASGNQGLVRISRTGDKAEIVAVGFRNPDGLGIYPDGTVTVPCSEGDWTPASMICAVKPKVGTSVPALDNNNIAILDKVPFFGHRGKQLGALSSKKSPRKNESPSNSKVPLNKPELPLVYLPRGLDNSAGGQVYIDSQRWGPVSGQMVHLSFGTGSQFLLLRDSVGDQMQGAVVPLGGQFLSGAHRGRFSPLDGQLYVSGMAGWGSYTLDRGSFERVRYTGTATQLPIGFHLHENGIAIKFSRQLDRAFVESAGEHFAQTWNYRYSSAYGSAEYSALHYGMRGHDQLRIASAHLMPDGQTLFLVLPDLPLCNQLHVQVAASATERFDLFATCNALDAPQGGLPGVNSSPRQLAAHPLDTDMLVLDRRVPNPWQAKLPKARPLSIEAGKNLSYSTRTLHAKAGEAIALTLRNPDVVPHNWALIKPGTLEKVGGQANRLVADPEAMIRQYVPQTSDVICYTDIVDPSDETVIHFKVPDQPGRYPFLCTFPGHWMVMNGELIVD